MAKFNDKISSLISSQLPDFVVDEHPQFLQFLKLYFTFMESAELQVTSIESTDGITLENETGRSDNLLLDGSKITSERTQQDADDKIILEDSSFGKFTVGETITGFTSKATATVLAEDLNNNRIFISSQDKFGKSEIITGNSSGAQAVINNYRPNPVQNIQELTNFRDPDKAISNFLTKFRDEFLKTIPEELALGLDKRNLIKNIKSMYRLKGTQKGHELFFRILFNQPSETFYPRTQMLRVSDGQWNTQKVLRSIITTGDSSFLIGRTITGQTSSATAVVETVKKFLIGSKEVSELVINEDTLSGTFIIGEQITGTASDTDDYFIKANITGIPGAKTITNDGSLYNTTDLLTVTGGGSGASIAIDDIGSGGVTEIIIDNAGSGYSVGDNLSFTNTGTEGVNAAGFVSVVNGAIGPEANTPGTIESDHIVLEDETQKGDPYTGNKIVQESGSGNEDITDVRIIDAGNGYTTFPTLTITSSAGSSATAKAYGTQIGRVLSLKTIEQGFGHENSASPPTLALPLYMLVTGKSGEFTVGHTVSATGSDGSTSITATIAAWDTNTNILKLTGATGEFGTDVTITSSGSITATIKRHDQATATATVGVVGTTDGDYINQDGHISETVMRIQDSLVYQDYSYIIKVGRSITDWRDTYSSTLHTAGFYFQGEVNIQSQLDLKLRNVT